MEHDTPSDAGSQATSKPSKRAAAAAPAGEDSGPPVSRRRVALACEECRERKRKCDGARPRCGGCSKRGPQQECVYGIAWKASWPARYFEDLNGRIAQLENIQRVVEPQLSHEHGPSSNSNLGLSVSNGFSHHPRPSEPSLQTARETSLGESRMETAENLAREERIPRDLNQDYAISLSTAQVSSGTEVRALSESLLTPAATLDESRLKQGGKSCVDAMGAVSGSAFDGAVGTELEAIDSAFFGPSSAVNFMSKVQKAIRKIGCIPQDDTDKSRPGGRATTQSDPRRDQTWHYADRSDSALRTDHEFTDYLFPCRSESDELIDSYFRYGHILHPFLHKPHFLQQYEMLWSAKGANIHQDSLDPDKIFRNGLQKLQFYVTLNLVFALGCRLNPSLGVGERVTKSERFYSRTQNSRRFEILHYGSLELVQSLLLMGLYLQTTERSEKCWNVVGLAVRIAQGIGLHLDAAQDGRYNQLEVEMRRRVWAGCLRLDCELSMTYGRPLMIIQPMNCGTHLPSIIDDELLSSIPGSKVVQPEGTPSLMAFPIHMLKLNGILSEILITSYSQRHGQLGNYSGDGQTTPDGSPDFDSRSLLAFDASLTQWQTNLPPFLKDSEEKNGRDKGDAIRQALFGADNITQSMFDRQARALYTQYLHIRILLLRPSLLMILDKEHAYPDPPTDPYHLNNIFQQTMLTKMSNLCVLTAQRQVDFILGKLNDDGFVHAWWYETYYVYSCAIVILIGRLCPSITGLSGSRGLAVSWEKALDCLKKYFDYSQPAQKGYKVLQMIDERLFVSRPSEAIPQNENLPERNQSDIRRDVSQHTATSGAADGRNVASIPGSEPHYPDSMIPEQATSIDDVTFNVAPDMIFNRDDLQFDWLNSMPFVQDEQGDGYAYGSGYANVLW